MIKVDLLYLCLLLVSVQLTRVYSLLSGGTGLSRAEGGHAYTSHDREAERETGRGRERRWRGSEKKQGEGERKTERER